MPVWWKRGNHNVFVATGQRLSVVVDVRPNSHVRNAPAAPLAADAIVKVGERVTIAPSTISGWEARLTRGWTAYDVTLDDKPVNGDQALEALYNSLREIQSAPKGKAK